MKINMAGFNEVIEADTVEIIGSGLVSRVIEGNRIQPIDNEEEARASLTRRGYKKIAEYRKRGQRREVWEKLPKGGK